MLSEEESKQRLEEVDENEDGKVSWKEYVQETFGIDLDGDSASIPLNDIEEQQVKFIRFCWQLDEKGKISKYCTCTKLVFDLYLQMLADDKALFTAADTNGDGYLDAVEFISFTHPEEDPKMLPVVLQQTLDSKDTNKDGEIDFKEFIGDRGSSFYFTINDLAFIHTL